VSVSCLLAVVIIATFMVGLLNMKVNMETWVPTRA
jgi:hypothetical protein